MGRSVDRALVWSLAHKPRKSEGDALGTQESFGAVVDGGLGEIGSAHLPNAAGLKPDVGAGSLAVDRAGLVLANNGH